MEHPMADALRRDELLADGSLRGAALAAALSEHMVDWLAHLFDRVVGDAAGDAALVAAGGLARGELSPRADLDLVLLHAPSFDPGPLSERLWYPMWDEGLKLGHRVGSVDQVARLAAEDLETATSLLRLRHVAGEETLTSALAERGIAQWRAGSKRFLAELDTRVLSRHEHFGEIAFLLEPDLKDGRGGLRDVHALEWVEATEPVRLASEVEELGDAYRVLLDARVELHRAVGGLDNRLLLERQDEVASLLGYADADELMAAVAGGARSIAWTSDASWRRVRRSLRGRRFRPSRPRQIAPGVLMEDRVVRVDPATAASEDPLVALRAAVVAANHHAWIDRGSLDLLAHNAPPLPVPWSEEARGVFTDLLLEGHAAIPVIEDLDQVGLLVHYLPEWAPCRSRPQRNAYHRFTVDRHLIEASAEAAKLVDRVERPDLLVLGALLHDIGKGYPGDHTEVGMELVRSIAGERMGYDPDEVEVLVGMVEHHLLLPDVATRRDLDDDGTIAHVADRVGSVEMLELLGALTEADSIATGPSAWGGWKANLVHELVARTAHVLRGGEVQDLVSDAFPSAAQRVLLDGDEVVINGEGETLTVVCDDRPGLFSRTAGVLALNGLDVLEAAAHSEPGRALQVFRVKPTFGDPPDWPRIADQVRDALDFRLALTARIADRARTYTRRRSGRARPATPTVTVDNDTSAQATVLEIAGPDRVGLLFRVTTALAELGLDIVSARIQTLGDDVVDAFYVRSGDGGKVTDQGYLDEIERAVLHAITAA
jgi:[protein-PII] uridylyltransferase